MFVLRPDCTTVFGSCAAVVVQTRLNCRYKNIKVTFTYMKETREKKRKINIAKELFFQRHSISLA